MAKTYWNFYGADNGCTFHRAVLPTQFCAPDMAERGVELLCGDGLPDGKDVYALHGVPTPVALYELMKRKNKGAKIVWSMDDDWLSLPDWNPAKLNDEGRATFEFTLQMADHIICSTDPLATTFRTRCDRKPSTVHVCPNLIDLGRFPVPRSETDSEGRRFITLVPKTPVRVVWAGSATHTGDVDEMTDALDEFCNQFVLTKRAELVFYGQPPPAKLISKYLHRGLYHEPMKPLAAYQGILNSIDSHVYLAPLAPINFNLSKSNLRVIEGWALCAAPIASDWGEYACVRNGVDGRLVKTPDQWLSALKRLVTDPPLRVEMAVRGRERVEARYNWANPECRRPWVEAFSEICEV